MAARATERESAPSAVLFDNIGARLVTGVVPGFASVCTLDYGAQVTVVMAVMAPLVIVVSIFRRGIFSGLTAGTVKG